MKLRSLCQLRLSSYFLASIIGLGLSLMLSGCGGGSGGSGGSGGGNNTPTPAITSISPTSTAAGSSDLTLTVNGSGFESSSAVLVGGTKESTTYVSATQLKATVPAAQMASGATLAVVVSNGSVSSASANLEVDNPAPTLTSISPSGGAIGVQAGVGLTGTGFIANSMALFNSQQVPVTSIGSTQIAAQIPASTIALPGNYNITATNPTPGGGTTSALPFTAYVSIDSNDIVYDAADGLIYASVPYASDGVAGNSVAGIDPNTGNVMRQFWVGSNPNKLALSTDDTQLFVGLDGTGAVAQVNLSTGAVVNQFSLGGGEGVYNPPYTATYLAAVPRAPNSVAVALSAAFGGGGNVVIYDSGVARPNSPSTVDAGPLSFGSSASILYVLSNGVWQLAVDTTGITSASNISTFSFPQPSSLQYDDGNLYLSSGNVISASTGALVGTFYSAPNSRAGGPVLSDSTLGRAFVPAYTGYDGTTGGIGVFDESSFNELGYIFVGTPGVAYSEKIVRWGQNGIAVNGSPGAESTTNELFIFQSPLVNDVSSSPADLSISLNAPAAATTGAAVSWTATVQNLGPNAAQGVSLAVALDSSLIVNSITPTQGTCGTGAAITCDLGKLANGASATVTVNATPTTAGTLGGGASVSSGSYDPVFTNNQSTTSTTVTGDFYAAVPVLSSISPNLVQAGASAFTLTVNGSGFTYNSVVNLGSSALTTTYVNATKLTAAVSAAQIANYGWASVTVSNPSPGGGVSQVVPLTIYNVVNVPATAILVDPYTQSLYATIPSTATTLAGNSVVAINPVTGVVGTPVAVGSQPTVMAETSDGNYLYIGLAGANNLAQFNLLQQSLTATIPLTPPSSISTNPHATSLSTMPGTDTTLAVSMEGSSYHFGILDVSGNTGTFRPNFSGTYEGVAPVFGDATHVYAYDAETSGDEFYRYNVDASGLTLIDGSTLDGLSGAFQLADGLVYGATGGIVNPSTTPPSQVATLQFSLNLEVNIGAFLADPSLQKEFIVGQVGADNESLGVARYDLRTYLPETTLTAPLGANSIVPGLWSARRWGQDGLALLSSGINYGATNQTVVQLILLRGPFVVPQELQTSTAASLTSSSASTIAHGTGNTILTLTGSHFLPGVAVTWNGSYRTTTIVDATHVSVAIPASDLASAGTASLVATNPGASASSALQITIN